MLLFRRTLLNLHSIQNTHIQHVQDEICGGYYAFDLYRLISAEEPTDPEYVGCYRDTDEERVMTDMLVDENMTTAICRSHCEGTGAEYYATQVCSLCGERV